MVFAVTHLGITSFGGLVQTHTLVSVSQGKYIKSLAVSRSFFKCSFVSLTVPYCVKSLPPAVNDFITVTQLHIRDVCSIIIMLIVISTIIIFFSSNCNIILGLKGNGNGN